MSGLKISQLPANVSLTGVEYVPAAQGGYTVRVSLNSLAGFVNTNAGTVPAARLPTPTTSTLGGVKAVNAVAHQWVISIDTTGTPQLSQPAFGDISGVATSAQLPTPTTSAIGGVKAVTAVAHQWVASIDTTGTPQLSQPAFTDLSGSVAASQLPALTGDVTSTAGTVSTTIGAGAVTLSKMANLAANSVIGNPTGSLATPTAVSPLTARSSSLLNIESVTTVGDTNYVMLPTDRFIWQSVAFTAARTWTLPDYTQTNPGHRIIIAPWGSSGTDTLTINTQSSQNIWLPSLTNVTSLTMTGGSVYEFINYGGGWAYANGIFSISKNGSNIPAGLVPPSTGGTTNFLRADGAWGPTFSSWTPTLSAASGTLGTHTLNAARYCQVGKMVNFYLDVTFTSAGTSPSSFFQFTLPTTPPGTSAVVGQCSGSEASTNAIVSGTIIANGGSSLGRCVSNTGSTAIMGNGQRITITGMYETS